jgi:hypothetical protein
VNVLNSDIALARRLWRAARRFNLLDLQTSSSPARPPLKGSRKWQKGLLYLSALLLLAIVVLTISWMTFPSYLLTGQAAKRYDALVHSISAYFGFQYVLILCSYYIPVSLRLSRRIRGLVYRAIGGAQAPNERMLENWEQKSGLLLHDLRSYKTVAALLAHYSPAS